MRNFHATNSVDSWTCSKTYIYNMSVQFVLCTDKLPYIWEVVHHIVDYAPGGNPSRQTAKRIEAVNAYTNALDLWCRASGSEFIATRKYVKKLLKHI